MSSYKKSYLSVLLIISISIFMGEVRGDNLIDQKKELERIQKDIDKSRINLDSLKGRERHIQKEISNYEQQESLNKTIIGRLNRQLQNLQNDISSSRENLDVSEKHHMLSNERFINNLKYYYTGTRQNTFYPGEEIERERQAFQRTIYLRALANYDREEMTSASKYLEDAEKQYTDLVDEEKSVDKVRKKKRSEYTIISSQREKREKDLSKVRREKEDETDRLITLSEAALQMEDLIGRLERARQSRNKSRKLIDFDFETGNFVTYKGRLAAPIKGKILNRFGWKTDKTTYLKSFSPGIEIMGGKNDPVSAVASGVVAYTGYIRGYSNFIILEHEDGYYSTYAGLEKLTVVQDQIIDRGEKLGITPNGIVKFELRKGRQPLDPVEWVKIESFQ